MKVDIKNRCEKMEVRVSLPLIDKHDSKTNKGGQGKQQKWEKNYNEWARQKNFRTTTNLISIFITI